MFNDIYYVSKDFKHACHYRNYPILEKYIWIISYYRFEPSSKKWYLEFGTSCSAVKDPVIVAKLNLLTLLNKNGQMDT